MSQPFSGTSERIFMKLTKRYRGKWSLQRCAAAICISTCWCCCSTVNVVVVVVIVICLILFLRLINVLTLDLFHRVVSQTASLSNLKRNYASAFARSATETEDVSDRFKRLYYALFSYASNYWL